jgi:hypothetical protein
MTTQITLLIRLLNRIRNFTDAQTDELGDLLDFSYGPDDADAALQLLEALRDLPLGVVQRVHIFVKAFEASHQELGNDSTGTVAITSWDKDATVLKINDVKALLRAAGVFKLDSGTVRIGHPHKGVVHSTTPAEPGTSHWAAEAGRKITTTCGDVKRAIEADERARRDALQEELGLTNPNETQRAVLRRSARIDRQKAEGIIPGGTGASEEARREPHPTDKDVAATYEALKLLNTEEDATGPMVRAEYAADPSLAEELEAAGWNLPDGPLIDTDDAGRWAHEFMTHWRQAPPPEGENWLEGEMIGWFANALETGKRIGAAQEKIRRDREDGEKLLKAVENMKAEKAAWESEHRLDENRRDRRDALLENLQKNHGEPLSPLEASVNIIVDLQDALTELNRDRNKELIGYKMVPENAIVFDVDDVNKRVAAAMAETMESLRRMGLG